MTNTFVDNYHTLHTDKLHVVEHFRLIDGGRTLEDLITVDDPGAFHNMVEDTALAFRAVSERGPKEARDYDIASGNPGLQIPWTTADRMRRHRERRRKDLRCIMIQLRETEIDVTAAKMKAAAQAAEIKRRQAQKFAQAKALKKPKQEDMFAPKKPQGTLFQKGAGAPTYFSAITRAAKNLIRRPSRLH